MASSEIYFHGPYCPQTWSLPDPIIHHIIENPQSTKVYKKLIKTCKYFFAKNSVIVVDELACISKDDQKLLTDKKWKNIKSSNIPLNFWITSGIHSIVSTETSLVSSIISKIFRIDATKLFLFYQTIFYNEFLFLSANVEEVILEKTVIKNGDKYVVPWEKIVAVLPKVRRINFCNDDNASSITSNTVKELLETPHFSKIEVLHLRNISELFDIEAFFTYIKKNQHSKIYCCFSNLISQAYTKKLETIVDEILGTQNHEYKSPLILYFGQNLEQHKSLKSLFDLQ